MSNSLISPKNLSLRKSLRAILLAAALGLFLLTPQIVDSIRSSVDFAQAPTVFRQIYYAVFVDRFTLLAIISAAIILRMNRRRGGGATPRFRLPGAKTGTCPLATEA